MKTFNLDDIGRPGEGWGACYDPRTRYGITAWSGTALDMLREERVPAQDRLWVVLREDVLDARTLRLFAVWCARRALSRVANPDPRSLAAVETAERFANGLATDDELDDAWYAAWDACARDACARAAWSAWSAAWHADRAAAGESHTELAAQIQHLITMIENNS